MLDSARLPGILRSMARRKAPEPEFPQSFETFYKPGSYDRANLTAREPSVFNGTVSIRRYRVTFEEVEEPREVLIDRLADLWRECKNHHHGELLRRAAAELGIELLYPTVSEPAWWRELPQT